MSTAGYSCWICPLCYTETREMTDQHANKCACGYVFHGISRLKYVVEDASRSAGSFQEGGDCVGFSTWINPAFIPTQKEKDMDCEESDYD